MSAGRRRLPLALLLSLLIHALLLSLTFSGQKLGLPGFAFPWKERRIEAPDLYVVLMPAKVTAAEPTESSRALRTLVEEPPKQASIKQSVAGEPTVVPPRFTAPILPRQAEAIALKSTTEPTKRIEPAPDLAISAVPAAVPAKTPLRSEVTSDAASTPVPAPVVIAVERSDAATFAVPPPSPVPTPVIAVAPSAPITPSPATVMPTPRDAGEALQKRADAEVRERAVEAAKPDATEREAERRRQADQLEATRVEVAQLEAARQEAARVEAARTEAQRQEDARVAAAKLEAQRQELARVEAARTEAQRQEAARVEVVRMEAQRQDAARLAAAQAAAQRQEGARQDAARLETDRKEAPGQAAAGQEAARVLAEKEEDTRREARRQAMGRVLNEEAAQREAAATAARSSSTLPYSLSTARRGRLWGRADPNAELVQYAEAWPRKIQFNTTLDTIREVAKRPHTDPMVTVAIRSDGSVESVTFVASSGVAEVDEAIRRIVQSLVPYPAFPPGLAREYDVIEVRRTWHFDTAVRLQ